MITHNTKRTLYSESITSIEKKYQNDFKFIVKLFVIMWAYNIIHFIHKNNVTLSRLI